MSYEQVDIYVLDTTASKLPIEGVVVSVYSADGSLFYTRSETDAEGKVGFLLSNQTYSLRFYKTHVGFTQPQLIEVLEQTVPPTVSNRFDVYGEVFTHPLAVDPRLCRASGFFRDVSGCPKRALDIHFVARFDPILLEGDAVVTERQIIRTDEDGYAQIDLIRFGNYCVMLQDREDIMRAVSVPDLASVNLPDLLFPRVKTVTLDPEGTFAMYVDDTVDVVPTVVTTDGRALDGLALSDVQWGSSDTAVATVVSAGDHLVITALASGTAYITATRRDSSIIAIPDTPIEVIDGDISVF